MTRSIRNAAVVEDLMTATRLTQTARIANAQMTILKPERALNALHADPPDRVFLDLERGERMLTLIADIRSEPSLAGVELIGFYPHVRADLRAAGLAAGLDRALPRSAFFARLARLVIGLVDSAGSTSEAHPEEPDMPNSNPLETSPARVPRVHISCPGCGRHDHVSWPEGQPVYHWKCFNCGKEFDLAREGAH